MAGFRKLKNTDDYTDYFFISFFCQSYIYCLLIEIFKIKYYGIPFFIYLIISSLFFIPILGKIGIKNKKNIKFCFWYLLILSCFYAYLYDVYSYIFLRDVVCAVFSYILLVILVYSIMNFRYKK